MPGLKLQIGGRKGPFSSKGNRHGNVTGGVKIETSPCHGAPIVYTKGGVQIPICQKCKEPISEITIR